MRPFLVTRLLPKRPVSFGFDGGSDDAAWDDTVGRALQSLAGSPIKPPPFDPGLLVPLDVEASRLLKLKDAARGARLMETWARTQGIETVVITDETEPVTVDRI